MSKKDNWIFYEEDWNEDNLPIRKIKRIKKTTIKHSLKSINRNIE